jgi:hypothetical protein
LTAKIVSVRNVDEPKTEFDMWVFGSTKVGPTMGGAQFNNYQETGEITD